LIMQRPDLSQFALFKNLILSLIWDPFYLFIYAEWIFNVTVSQNGV
jgi:hypothetical protein